MITEVKNGSNPWADPKIRQEARERAIDAESITLPIEAFLAMLDLIDEVHFAVKH